MMLSVTDAVKIEPAKVRNTGETFSQGSQNLGCLGFSSGTAPTTDFWYAKTQGPRTRTEGVEAERAALSEQLARARTHTWDRDSAYWSGRRRQIRFSRTADDHSAQAMSKGGKRKVVPGAQSLPRPSESNMLADTGPR